MLVLTRKANESIRIGDEIEVIMPWNEFGRTAIAAAKQLLIQKVREAEREKIVAEYADRVGELVTGSVQQIDKGNIIVHLGRAEGIVPLREQIPREKYRQGDRIRLLAEADVHAVPGVGGLEA